MCKTHVYVQTCKVMSISDAILKHCLLDILMGINCAPVVADLFLFRYETFFIKSLSRETLADIIEAFNPTFIYISDLLNIDNIHVEQMVDRIYPAEFKLNEANSSDTEAPVLDVNFSINNGTVSTKIYDKRDDFNVDVVNFPLLDGDVPRRTSYGVHMSQLTRFDNVCLLQFCNKALTAKLLKQGYRYHELRKVFSKVYRRHGGLVEKYNVSLKKLQNQGISESEFYGDLVYRIRMRNKCGEIYFSEQFRKLINHYKRIGYNHIVCGRLHA